MQGGRGALRQSGEEQQGPAAERSEGRPEEEGGERSSDAYGSGGGNTSELFAEMRATCGTAGTASVLMYRSPSEDVQMWEKAMDVS